MSNTKKTANNNVSNNNIITTYDLTFSLIDVQYLISYRTNNSS